MATVPLRRESRLEKFRRLARANKAHPPVNAEAVQREDEYLMEALRRERAEANALINQGE